MNIITKILTEHPFNVKYDKFDLEIKIRKRETEHNVKCSFRSIGNYKEAYNSIFRFFNEIVWFYRIPVFNINGSHSQGSHVFINYFVDSDWYLPGFHQMVYDESQHLALAFFREAVCNESPYYRFLCFDKILQMPFTKKQQRTLKAPWIESQLSQLTDELAINFRDRRMTSLDNKSLAAWLYEDGRHPIAHAHLGEFIRDPNNYDHWDEIKWANTVMQDLAEKCIIDKLKVPKR